MSNNRTYIFPRISYGKYVLCALVRDVRLKLCRKIPNANRTKNDSGMNDTHNMTFILFIDISTNIKCTHTTSIPRGTEIIIISHRINCEQREQQKAFYGFCILRPKEEHTRTIPFFLCIFSVLDRFKCLRVCIFPPFLSLFHCHLSGIVIDMVKKY